MHLIFIRHPYPYTLEEYHAIESVLRQLYASATITYVREYPGNGEPVDHLLVDRLNKTTIGSIALFLRAIHMVAYRTDSRFDSLPAIEVEIRHELDGRPAWATSGLLQAVQKGDRQKVPEHDPSS